MTTPDEHELLAGEYALGCLEGDDLALAERLLRDDAAFRAAVERWEHRLMPLINQLKPVSPDSALWRRIEASLGAASFGPASASVPPHPGRPNRIWQFAAAAGFAVAACLGAILVLQPPPDRPLAVLAPVGDSQPYFIAEQTGSRVRITAVGPSSAPDGKDYELWSLPPGAAKPVSLGVLAARERIIDARLSLGTQLLVSLEPKGGSPTGQPTGPVIFAGKVTPL